jgi:pimeloyl-ACP methyl ester carboxylesterase
VLDRRRQQQHDEGEHHGQRQRLGEVAHGRNDALILPAAAEMTAAAIKGARISWYDDCGHSPFFEHAERFNRELDAFVSSIEAADGG